MDTKHCIIVGGGHAAAQLGPSLRQQGWQGRITIVSDEPVTPYQRPPLSKGYLLGDQTFEQILIKPPKVYTKAEVDFKLGMRAERIDRQTQQLHLNNGEVLEYDKLALTPGARVRELDVPGVDLDGVCYLRTIADLDRIKPFTQRPGKNRAVIIGGGYIGLETAAVLRKIGMQVTVLEAMPRLLQRVTSEEISAFYQRIHTEEGVDIHCEQVVSAIEGEHQVEAVRCVSGDSFAADLVVIGIGVIPNTELAAEAGLETGAGIVVNEAAQTSDPNIVAAGDCTTYYSALYQRMIRLESVPNAVGQATCAAATLCGKASAYQALPWFWSDQYDLKLQMAGLSQGYEQVIVRGDLKTGRHFSVFYLKSGKLLALDCVNQPKDFMLGKKLIASQNSVDADILADPAKDLVGLLKPTI